MLFANNNLDRKIRATPKKEAKCPHCKEGVLSKCGSINIWHWAHKTKCIYETEPMTEWHIAFQELALKNGCDIEYNMKEHIADALKKNTVFEFQHSPISQEEILSRCNFYQKQNYRVDWIFNLQKNPQNIKISEQTYRNFKESTFYWNWAKKNIACLFVDNKLCYGNLYLDIGLKKYILESCFDLKTKTFIDSYKEEPFLFKITEADDTMTVGKGMFLQNEEIFRYVS